MAVVVSTCVLVAGCGGGSSDGESGRSTSTRSGPHEARSPVTFTDVAASSGLTLRQQPRVAEPPHCLFSGTASDVPEKGSKYNPGAAALVACEEERMSGGAAVGDFDADGDPDLYLTRVGAPGTLYRNDGKGTFTDVSAEYGLDDLPIDGNGAGWADLTNDGYPDLYVTTLAASRFYLFMNDGSGRFEEQAVPRGVGLADDVVHTGFSVNFGDYDRDGYVDISTTEWRAPPRITAKPPEHARLFHNLGAARPGYFEDVTERAGVTLDGVPTSLPEIDPAKGTVSNHSFASTFVDLDGDGWQDLVVAGDYRTSRIFWNTGKGTFTDGTAASPFAGAENAMGSTFGDYDGDGDLDWFVTGIQNPPDACKNACVGTYTGNRLYRNDGHRHFTDVTERAGVADGAWGWGAGFVDVDLDGDLDLVMTNGQDYGDRLDLASQAFVKTPKRLWINDGHGRFALATASSGIDTTREGKGLALLDADGDGDVDIVMANTGERPNLYRNGGTDAHRLGVHVVGRSTNRDALGAIVRVYPAGGGPPQVREVGVATHFLGQSELTTRFGLGRSSTVDRIEVDFPRSHRTVTIEAPKVDEVIQVIEPG